MSVKWLMVSLSVSGLALAAGTATKPTANKAGTDGGVAPAKTDAGTAAVKTDAGTAAAKTDAGPAASKPETKTEAKPVGGGTKYTLVAVAAPDKALERSWKGKCGACHGVDGKAATEKGKKMKMEDLSAAKWQTSHSDAEIRETILKGLKKDEGGVKKTMEGFEGELKPEQLDGLIKYVRWLGAPK